MKKTHLMRLAAAVALPALLLTGCSRAETGGDGGGGESVPVGATAEQYQEALAEMEPVELTYQTVAASATSTSGQRDAAWAADIEEWSGGKIKIKVVYGTAVAPPAEISAALADGRLDIAHWLTSYHADEMKAYTELQNALVSVPTSPLVGEIAQHLVAQEVAFNSEEVMKEFDAHGMTVLNPYNTSGAILLACADEKNSPSDFQGDQIRANAQAQGDQINALGGSTVTMQLSETYEGLQRGVIQCTFGSPTSVVNSGWVETAPHIYVPQDSSFVTGPGSLVAGASWEQLPLAAQQLIFDRTVTYNIGELGQTFVSTVQLAEKAAEQGGEISYLDEGTEAALVEGNASILESVRAADNLDGGALIGAVEESVTKWQDVATELGYEDGGDYTDFAEWYQGNGEVVDEEYLAPIVDRFYDEVLAEHRPE